MTIASRVANTYLKTKPIVFLDLDNTLVNASENPHHDLALKVVKIPIGYDVEVRPGLYEFLAGLSNFAEVYIYSAGTDQYIQEVVDALGLRVDGFFSSRHHNEFPFLVGRSDWVLVDNLDFNQYNTQVKLRELNLPNKTVHNPNQLIHTTTFDGVPDDELTHLLKRVQSHFGLNKQAVSSYDLEYLLSPRGKVRQIGAEKGRYQPNGISLFVSPHGSYRYVWSVGGEIVGVAQFMSRDGKKAISSNTYVDPSYRRQGIATKLQRQALKDFEELDYHADRSDDGDAWVKSVTTPKQAAKGIYWHGTSSKYLRQILKMGLVPVTKEKQYQEELRGDAGGRSIATYGGVYVTTSWSLAHGHAESASMKMGGEPVMVGMELETRTPTHWMDEDDLLPWVERSVNTRNQSSLIDTRSFWGVLFAYKNWRGSWGYPGEVAPQDYLKLANWIESANLKDPTNDFWSIVVEKHPRLKYRYEQQRSKIDPLIEELFRAHAIHLLETLWANNVKRISISETKKLEQNNDRINDLQFSISSGESEDPSYDRGQIKTIMGWSQTIRENLNLLRSTPSEIKGSYSRIVKATADLSKALKELSDPSPNEYSSRQNLRLQKPVTYRGNNRIVWVSVDKSLYNGSKKYNFFTDIQLLYTTNPGLIPLHLSEYKKAVGSTYRFLDKSGRVLHQSVADYVLKESAWPEEWGDKDSFRKKGTHIKMSSDADSFAKSLESRYDVELWMTGPYEGNPPIVNLRSIVVPKDDRGIGIGTKVMLEITQWADRNGYILSLTPSKDFGGKITKLRVFYKRFGFVLNKGRNKSFRTQDAFIRYPLGLKQADQIPGGLGDKKKPKDFDPKQLAKGIQIEMEHTKDKSLAQEIAMDHLTELPDYYDRLEKIEKHAAKQYPGPNVPKLEGLNDDVDWTKIGEKLWIGGQWPLARQSWTPMPKKAPLDPGQPWKDGTLSFTLFGVTPTSSNIGMVRMSQVLFKVDGSIEPVSPKFQPHPDELEEAQSYWKKYRKTLQRRLQHFSGEYYLRAGEWSDVSKVFLDDDTLEGGYGSDRVTERRFEEGVSVLRVTPRLEGGWYVKGPDPREAIYHIGGNYLTQFFKGFSKGRKMFLVQGKRVKLDGEFLYGSDGEPLLEPGTLKKVTTLTLEDLYLSKNAPISKLAMVTRLVNAHVKSKGGSTC